MQNEEFDDLIRRKMQGSQSTPPPLGFERIRASLPESRRRFAFWFWVPALLFFVSAGGGVWLFQTSNQLPEARSFYRESGSQQASIQAEAQERNKTEPEINVANKQTLKEAAILSKNISADEFISESSAVAASEASALRNKQGVKTLGPINSNPVVALSSSNSTRQANKIQFETPFVKNVLTEEVDFILLKEGSVIFPPHHFASVNATLLDTAGMTWAHPSVEKGSYSIQFEPFASVKWASKNISIQSAEQMDVAKQSRFSSSRFQYEAGLNVHKNIAPFMRIFGGVSVSYLQDETSVVQYSTISQPCNLYQSEDGNMHLLPKVEAHNLNIRYRSLMVGGQLGSTVQLTSKLGVWGNFRLHRQWKDAEVQKEGYVNASLHTRWLPSAAIGLSQTLIVRDGYRFSLDPFVELYAKGAIRVGDMYQSKPMFFGVRASVLLN